MQAHPVDPRDERWEDTTPVYRVYFWDDSGRASEEWRLTEACDVIEVLNWARADATGRQFVLYAEVNRNGAEGPGLVRLLGHDPTEPQS